VRLAQCARRPENKASEPYLSDIGVPLKSFQQKSAYHILQQKGLGGLYLSCDDFLSFAVVAAEFWSLQKKCGSQRTKRVRQTTVRSRYKRQLIRLNKKKKWPTRTGMEDSRPILFCKRFSYNDNALYRTRDFLSISEVAVCIRVLSRVRSSAPM